MKKFCILGLVLALILATVSCSGSRNETKIPDSSGSMESGESDKSPSSVTINKTVHLRQEASVSSGSITQIPKGSQVEWLSDSEDGAWSRIRFEGSEGYVPKENLDTGDKTPSGNTETKADPETDKEETSSESQEETSSTQTESDPAEDTTESSSETSSSVTPSESYSDPANGVLSDNGMFDLTGLSNKSIPYGNDWEQKDEIGLAAGIHYYENMYGKYFPVYRIKTTEKLLYLTMDEGYEAGHTPKILDILKEKNVPCVFFLTKQFYDSNPELIQRMIDEGHILGNHTIRHPAGGYPKYVDEHGLDSFTEDVSNMHKLIYDTFGYKMKLFRFPEGESSELLMAKLNNLGYTPVFWSYAHRDFVLDDQPEVSVTLQRCLDHMAPGAVYLLHAVSSSNTEALSDFIDQARAQGYEFARFPVDEVTAR